MWRCGLIGAGNVAMNGHLPVWLAREDVTLAAATDVRPEAQAALAAAVPEAGLFGSVEALLDSGPLDFVDICTPPAAHGRAIRAALEQDAHVLCEKPLVLDAAELSELEDLAARRGRVLATVHNWKHAPILARASELVRAGEVGRVRRCRWEVLRERPSIAAAAPSENGGNWRLDPAQSGGGILVDHGWHAAYMLAGWIGGPLLAASGRLETRRHRGFAVEDTAEARLELAGGEAEMLLTWAADERANRVEIEGDAGRIRIDGDVLEVDGSSGRKHTKFSESLSEGSHHPDWFAGVAGEFLDCLSRAGGEAAAPHPSLAESTLCLEAIALVQESSRRGGARVAAAGAPEPAAAGALRLSERA